MSDHAGFARGAAAIEAAGRRHRYTHAGQMTFSCPGPNHANGDRNPSGSLTDDPARGSAGIYCHAGCPAEDIATGLGLDLRDLFDVPLEPRDRSFPPDTSTRAAVASNGWMPCADRRKGGTHRVAAAHNYTDPRGRFLAQKLRCDHKGRCPNGGVIWRRLDRSKPYGWTYNRQGVDVRLYRPEVIEWAKRNEHTIYLTEGESDADAFHAIRIPATTAPDGAWVEVGQPGRKWRPEYTEMLRGAHVCIVPDRDKAGKAHGENVATAILPVVASLEIAVAAKGKDARDHFAAGLKLADLVTIANPKPFMLERPADVLEERAAGRVAVDPVVGITVDYATGEIFAPNEAVAA
jgi:hypothetical protein